MINSKSHIPQWYGLQRKYISRDDWYCYELTRTEIIMSFKCHVILPGSNITRGVLRQTLQHLLNTD